MHQAARAFYPLDATYPIQTEEVHSNIGQLGIISSHTTDIEPLSQRSNPNINLALFHTQDHLENYKSTNACVNHHVGGHENLYLRSVPLHHNEERGESSITGGRVCSKGREKILDLEESLVAERLWNFEASHDNLYRQAAASAPLLTAEEFAAAVQHAYDSFWIVNHQLDRNKLQIPMIGAISNLKNYLSTKWFLLVIFSFLVMSTRTSPNIC